MSRRSDRRHAFNLIFQLGFFEKQPDIEAVFNDYLENHVGDKIDKEFVYQEFSGVCQNMEKLDALLDTSLKGWTTARLNKTDLAILRLAAYEMLYDEKIPPSVAINEAVELAKDFSEDESPGFVNAVLGSVSKRLSGDNA